MLLFPLRQSPIACSTQKVKSAMMRRFLMESLPWATAIMSSASCSTQAPPRSASRASCTGFLSRPRGAVVGASRIFAVWPDLGVPLRHRVGDSDPSRHPLRSVSGLRCDLRWSAVSPQTGPREGHRRPLSSWARGLLRSVKRASDCWETAVILHAGRFRSALFSTVAAKCGLLRGRGF